MVGGPQALEELDPLGAGELLRPPARPLGKKLIAQDFATVDFSGGT